jgi:DNA replication protein DnaC
LLILDDLAYVSKDQAETSVLFDAIASSFGKRVKPLSTAITLSASSSSPSSAC